MDERDVLVGREREVAALIAALASHRVVTITGLGGIGKTRLALELAARAATQGRSCTFVDLAPVSAASGVIDAIAAALGTVERPGAGSRPIRRAS